MACPGQSPEMRRSWIKGEVFGETPGQKIQEEMNEIMAMDEQGTECRVFSLLIGLDVRADRRHRSRLLIMPPM